MKHAAPGEQDSPPGGESGGPALWDQELPWQHGDEAPAAPAVAAERHFPLRAQPGRHRAVILAFAIAGLAVVLGAAVVTLGGTSSGSNAADRTVSPVDPYPVVSTAYPPSEPSATALPSTGDAPASSAGAGTPARPPVGAPPASPRPHRTSPRPAPPPPRPPTTTGPRVRSGPVTGYLGKCMDVAGANNANGTTVDSYTCNGTNAQVWTISTDGTVRALGKCLDAMDHGTGNGTRVQLWSCTGGANQQWRVTAGHDLVNPIADRCLDVTDHGTWDGVGLQLWDCTGGSNQKWYPQSH